MGIILKGGGLVLLHAVGYTVAMGVAHTIECRSGAGHNIPLTVFFAAAVTILPIVILCGLYLRKAKAGDQKELSVNAGTAKGDVGLV